MNLSQTLPAIYADAANSVWHEVVVFGIGIVYFVIIMTYAIKGDFGRRPKTESR